VVDILDTVFTGIDTRHIHDRNHVAPNVVVGLDHLRQCTALTFDDVVVQQDSKRFIADQMLCLSNGMTQP
jgi:hypothetical protein